MKDAPMKVVIAGGGVARLEARMALRELAEERVSLELVTPTPEFAYRPLAVAEPFGLGDVRRYDVPRMAADHDAAVHIASVKERGHGHRRGAHSGSSACGLRPRKRLRNRQPRRAPARFAWCSATATYTAVAPRPCSPPGKVRARGDRRRAATLSGRCHSHLPERS